MTETTKNSNQKVTNAKLWGKLEVIDGKLEKLDAVCEHVIRCEERWEAQGKTNATMRSDIKGAKDSKGWLAALGVGITAGVGALWSIVKNG